MMIKIVYTSNSEILVDTSEIESIEFNKAIRYDEKDRVVFRLKSGYHYAVTVDNQVEEMREKIKYLFSQPSVRLGDVFTE